MPRFEFGVLVATAVLAASCGGGSTADVAAVPTTVGPAGGSSAAVVTTAPPDPGSTTTPVVCDFGGPALGVDAVATSPERPSTADHLSAVTVDRSAGCGRLVISLGTNFSYDTPGPAADRVPGAVTASIIDNTLRVVLTGIERVDIDSVDPDLGDGAILARRPSPYGDLEAVLFPEGAFGDFSVQFLKSPARIVVDFSERALTQDEVEVPVASGDVIIQSISTMPQRTTSIIGFARPFEAQMEAEVVDKQGDAVSVVCSDGCYNGGSAVTRLGVPTTDWAEAWGEFEFTLVGLSPGSYTARFSNDAGAIESASWLEVPMSIGS